MNNNNITINLEILEARNLIDADRSISAMLQSNDTSDPYVAVMLMGLEDDEKKEIEQTDVVYDNVNPVWKHTMTKKHIDLDKTGVLRLSVRDYDQFSRDSKIGNVDLPLIGLIGKGKIEGWFKLQRTHKMMKKNTQTSGELRIAIKVTYERVNLAMTIIRGKDVLDMDQSMFAASATDVSDPYVVAMLRSEEKKTMKVLGRTWYRFSYTFTHSCHSIVSLTRNNTTRMLRKYSTRASRSNTGTAVLEDKKNPVWNHKVVEEDIDLREMKTIRLDVRDKDTYVVLAL